MHNASSAGRHEDAMASAVETEPLFAAGYEDDDIAGASKDRHSSNSETGTPVNGHAEHERLPSGRYPPPKYLKSTYTSREHEFDASDDVIDTGAEADPNDVPLLTGLLQSARSRGSIDVHRRGSSGSLSADDAAFEQGLVVGLGQGGGLLASVS
jgi:hypothetical protein